MKRTRFINRFCEKKKNSCEEGKFKNFTTGVSQF